MKRVSSAPAMRGAAGSSSAMVPPPIAPRKRSVRRLALLEAGRGHPADPGRSGEGVLDHRPIFLGEPFAGDLLARPRFRRRGDMPLADRVERQIPRLPDHYDRSQKAFPAGLLGLADGKVLGETEERLFHFFRIGGGDELRLLGNAVVV